MEFILKFIMKISEAFKLYYEFESLTGLVTKFVRRRQSKLDSFNNEKKDFLKYTFKL